MAIDLSGKVALVTGSSRGIGKAIALRLAEAGADVVLNGRGPSAALDETAAAIAAVAGREPLVVTADVADATAISAMFRAIFGKAGRLDVLVNNAGVLNDGLMGMIRAEDIERTLAVNTVGTLLAIQAGGRLIQRQGGSIINLSSIIGVRGNEGQLAYSASKGAVIAATYSAAKELAARNVRVNAIAPGYIDTDMIRAIPPQIHQQRLDSIAMGRIGTPGEVADVALFLASDLSRYVTGQVIGVDGGMLI